MAKKSMINKANKKQKFNTFCIVCDYGLDSRVIEKLRKTRVENIEKLLDNIKSKIKGNQ